MAITDTWESVSDVPIRDQWMCTLQNGIENKYCNLLLVLQFF